MMLAFAAPIGVAAAANCPPAGGSLAIEVIAPSEVEPSALLLSGELQEASCEHGGSLASSYTVESICGGAHGCSHWVDGLAPGRWVHRIAVLDGTGAGQRQARRGLVLDAGAGIHHREWRIHRTVLIVENLDDDLDCEGCLRQALAAAEFAAGPILIQFAEQAVGDVVLFDVLPELNGAPASLDALDAEGLPHRRTIDAGGLTWPALRIRSGGHHVIGLRLVNSGGNNDVLLIEGPAAADNLVESVQVVGRSLEVCQSNGVSGCVIDGECRVADEITPRGHCGDDGIAVRDDAGAFGANVLRDVDVSGAFDKGIKVSEGGYALIERSRVYGNRDGGIQATLGGSLTAVENISEANRGTTSANGISANGPRIGGNDPATLITRGNLVRYNSLRGISVRSLSQALLRDDYVCGNGDAALGAGFGVAVIDGAGFSALADIRGLALAHNERGGVATDGNSIARLGDESIPGLNAFAYNGASLAGRNEIRNLSIQSMSASGNHWDRCGRGYRCNELAVRLGSVDAVGGAVAIEPARASTPMRAPVIEEIRPTYAAAGDLVWIYGRGFDAIDAAAQTGNCDGTGRACRAADPNCVFFGRESVEVVAATPTLLVIRAPFTCVEPVPVAARTSRSRGFARATFCTVDEISASSPP